MSSYSECLHYMNGKNSDMNSHTPSQYHRKTSQAEALYQRKCLKHCKWGRCVFTVSVQDSAGPCMHTWQQSHSVFLKPNDSKSSLQCRTGTAVGTSQVMAPCWAALLLNPNSLHGCAYFPAIWWPVQTPWLTWLHNDASDGCSSTVWFGEAKYSTSLSDQNLLYFG